MKIKIMSAILILLTVSLALGASDTLAGPFGEIVVFGDSLSDNGNLLLTDIQPIPDPAVYWEGHFSNGPVWVEYLTNPTHFDTKLTDRAFGGAQTTGVTPPGLIEQVRAHIVTTGSQLRATNLYVIWIGGNDFLNGSGDFKACVGRIQDAMKDLVDNGAKSLLILNLPDLGAIPAKLGTPDAPLATAFTVNFNAELATMIDAFSTAHPGIQIYEFDIAALFQEVLKAPSTFGFVNVTQPAPKLPAPNNFDSSGYLFWDEEHPTTSMHSLIADRVYSDLNAQVPASAPEVAAKSGESSSCFMQTMAWE